MKKKFENQKLAHDILNIPIGLEVKSEEQASVQRLVVVSNDCDLELQAHKAIVNNDVNLFSYLVENRNIVLTKTNEYGQNILHIAASKGSVEVMKYILNNENIKIEPTATDDQFSLNILHFATLYGNMEAMMEYILNNENIKIEPTATDKDGQNILHIAASNGNLEMMEYILNNDKINIDTTATDKDGHNILHIAAVNGNLEMMEYILNNEKIKIKPTAIDKDDQNILHFAASRGNLEMMKYILNNENIKIEPTAKDKDDQNILHIAASKGNLEMMEYILNNDKINIDPTATYKDDQNILHIAAYLGNLVMIKYILKTGLIDKISSDLYDTLTQQSDSSFTNSIKAIQYLLDDQEYEVDFSKQKFDEDLLLKMFKYYVCRPQLAQHTILELKEIYIKKAKNAQLPEALVDGIPDILNEWAKEIFSQECDLMSQDYTNLHIQLDNLHIQLANRIKPAKKLQDFIESPDDKKEKTEAKIEQLVAKPKMNFTGVVDVAGTYLNTLAELSNDEILMKCKIKENFAEALKSINPLFLNKETQEKFSDIIKTYEANKDDLDINFQDLIITEESGPNVEVTNPEHKAPMGDYEPGLSFFE